VRQEAGSDSKRLEQLANRLEEIAARNDELGSFLPQDFNLDAGSGLPIARQIEEGSDARRLGIFTVGTSSRSGCYELADSQSNNSYDMAASSCNGQNCPSCFITPTVLSSDVTLSIANCSSHIWGFGTRTQSRTGVWSYVFINRHPTFELTVKDGIGHYTVLPMSHIEAWCDSASGVNRLFFPTSKVPTLIVENTMTLESGDFDATTQSGTFSVLGDVILDGHVTVAADHNFRLEESGNGTFHTGTGQIILNGDTWIVGKKTFMVGSPEYASETIIYGDVTVGTVGQITLNGDTLITGNRSLTVGNPEYASPTVLFGDLTVGTIGQITLNGDTLITGNQSLTVGSPEYASPTVIFGDLTVGTTGQIILNGDTFITGNQSLTVGSPEYASPTVMFGDFTVGTIGKITLNGDTLITGNQSLTVGSPEYASPTVIFGDLTVGTTGKIALNGDTLITGNQSLTVGSPEYPSPTVIFGDLTVGYWEDHTQWRHTDYWKPVSHSRQP
jgi:hypothetical protein